MAAGKNLEAFDTLSRININRKCRKLALSWGFASQSDMRHLLQRAMRAVREGECSGMLKARRTNLFVL
jgi:hypothetical protein